MISITGKFPWKSLGILSCMQISLKGQTYEYTLMLRKTVKVRQLHHQRECNALAVYFLYNSEQHLPYEQSIILILNNCDCFISLTKDSRNLIDIGCTEIHFSVSFTTSPQCPSPRDDPGCKWQKQRISSSHERKIISYKQDISGVGKTQLCPIPLTLDPMVDGSIKCMQEMLHYINNPPPPLAFRGNVW